MFWRKTRDAIEKFQPMHQMVVFHRVLYTTQDRAGWDAILHSMRGHDAIVKRSKWSLPPRTFGVIVPLVGVVLQDMPAAGAVAVTADLRGSSLPEKTGPRHQLPVQRPVRSAMLWYEVDPWLRVRAALRDGSTIDVSVVDRIRYRRVHKVNPRGKSKTKTKKKEVQLIRVTRALPKGVAGVRPATRPPSWMRVKMRPGRRAQLTVTGRLDRIPDGEHQVHFILSVLAETFRWTAS
jgi:hypothetical protein